MPKFRESQRQIIEEYAGGMLGIAAVPGSGKTFTLSHLAARLVSRLLQAGTTDQEVLVVTFSNSAVNSFKKRIGTILQEERQLLPHVGYRVRTLHGLAHDIVRERPTLVGLADDFAILDERASAAALAEIVRAQLPAWSHLMDEYLKSDLSEKQASRVRHEEFPRLMVDIVTRFIKTAKDYRQTPASLLAKLQHKDSSFELARFAVSVYDDYQRSLAFRGAVDFDDLVFLAYEALLADPQYLERLQRRWVYTLEDEAQDSSHLQEQMLRLLTGEKNWVRVGDPNQAINTTFTTANPQYLLNFLADPRVQVQHLPVSGRSTQKIIDLANKLVQWTTEEHPAEALRDTFYPQEILPTTPDDPQRNPDAQNCSVYFDYREGQKITPDEEIARAVGSVARWLPENPDKTVAILAPENRHGYKVAEALRQHDIPVDELLRSTSSVRHTVNYLILILQYLSTSYNNAKLCSVFQNVWLPMHAPDYEYQKVVDKYFRDHRNIEALIFDDTPLEIAIPEEDQATVEAFLWFIRWALLGLELPIDQLVLALSQRLFTEPYDIALSYKVAALLRSLSRQNPSWRIEDFVTELELIAQNQRRFLGFEDVGTGFEPQPGVVTVGTMHSAKGLEWNRVYLLGVSTYGFPSLMPDDHYIFEKWFVADGLNLDAYLLAQLFDLVGLDRGQEDFTFLARRDYAAERLRLLYVSITRAQCDLALFSNVGLISSSPNLPALPYLVLI